MSVYSQDSPEEHAVRTALRALKTWNTYEALMQYFEINTKELCNLVKYDWYEPPRWVWKKLGAYQPRNLERATIYRGTPPADVVRKLAALGHEVTYVTKEIEY